jgi:pimeloyl-ACP methyl ester carboxylesterase
LPRVLARAEIEQFSLVGHSDGATIALVFAGTVRPAGLRSVVAMAPHVIAEPIGIASIEAVNREYREGDLRQRLAKYHGGNVDCAFRGWCDSWLDPDFSHWSVESHLAGISVPVLLIQGRDDQYGTEEQLQRIERGVTGTVSTVLLDACGHAPHQDQPRQTLAAIRNFCH